MFRCYSGCFPPPVPEERYEEEECDRSVDYHVYKYLLHPLQDRVQGRRALWHFACSGGSRAGLGSYELISHRTLRMVL
jgi:hypothetical protein